MYDRYGTKLSKINWLNGEECFFLILMECNVTGIMAVNTVNMSIFCPYNNLWVLNFHKSVLLQERFHIISM